MTDTLQRVRELLEQRLAEVEGERGRLSRALRELGAKPPTASGTGVRTHQAGNGRLGHGERQAQVVNYLREHPGSSTGDVAQGLGISTSQASAISARLSRLGSVRKTKTGLRLTPKGVELAGSRQGRGP